MSWRLFRGEIPEGIFVLHKCDVPACVNPDHLFLGDHVANMKDAAKKKRIPGGKGRTGRRSRSRLTEEIVKQARELYSAGETQTSIGKLLGIHQTTVSNIVRMKSWPDR